MCKNKDPEPGSFHFEQRIESSKKQWEILFEKVKVKKEGDAGSAEQALAE